MRKFLFLKICLVFMVIILLFTIITLPKQKSNVELSRTTVGNSYRYYLYSSSSMRTTKAQQKAETNKIVISFVVCDSRFNESLNVVKSALIFSKAFLHFVIFADNGLQPKFQDTLGKWKTIVKNKFDFELHAIQFPEDHKKDWMNLFSKCAAQRLFIPNIVKHIDAIIYVDTDTLFLGPVEDLWENFNKFNTSQISALTLEDDNPNVSWYPRFAKHPFYGKYGLNSGVMLMNLTRMRNFGWTDYVAPIMLKWKLYIPWGDQDIINVIFHYHPDAVLVLECRLNYRSDQCTYGDACAAARADGALVVHGSRGAFHGNRQPAFKAVYRAINEYNLGTSLAQVLVNMNRYFSEAPASNCGALKDVFFKLPSSILTNKRNLTDR